MAVGTIAADLSRAAASMGSIRRITLAFSAIRPRPRRTDFTSDGMEIGTCGPTACAASRCPIEPAAVTSSREDFHLQVNAHAGRTDKNPGVERRGGKPRARGIAAAREIRVASFYDTRLNGGRWPGEMPSIKRAS